MPKLWDQAEEDSNSGSETYQMGNQRQKVCEISEN